MAVEVDESGDWLAFPTIQPGADGKLARMGTHAAQRKALKDKNYKSFGKDKNAALAYGEGGYKQGTPLDSDLEKQRRLAELLRGGYR